MTHQYINLVGFLGADPEMRYLPNGNPVCNFSMATSRRWTNRETGEKQEETVWWRIASFNQAEACQQYLSKGRQVMVEGRVKPNEAGNPRVWQRQDGTHAASFEVTAFNVKFLGKRTDADASPAQTSAPGVVDSDGIPF